jgi:predicted  nucleic acid-binding Zn-ribbon protein
MGAVLDALYHLQESEQRLVELKQRIESRHRAVRNEEKKVAQLEAELDKRRLDIRNRQMEADRLDVDVKANEERMAKFRVALNASKTNKEYSTILTQLNTQKADNAKVEERLLNLLNEIDADKKALGQREEAVAAEHALLADLRKAARDFEQEHSAELERLRNERLAAAEAVPPDALRRFERVAEKHGGMALAEVVRTNPKRAEYACGECHMAVTLEQVNTLTTRDDPITCNTCGRILYIERAVPHPAR